MKLVEFHVINDGGVIWINPAHVQVVHFGMSPYDPGVTCTKILMRDDYVACVMGSLDAAVAALNATMGG